MKLSKQSHTFQTAGQAASAIALFDDAEPKMHQYEVRLVRAQNFAIQGFEARVMDFDGFGVGFVAP